MSINDTIINPVACVRNLGDILRQTLLHIQSNFPKFLNLLFSPFILFVNTLLQSSTIWFLDFCNSQVWLLIYC